MGVKCGKKDIYMFKKIDDVVILSLSGSQENCQEISRLHFTPKIRNYILHKCWTEILYFILVYVSGFDFFNYCIVMMNKIVFTLYKFGGNVHIVIKPKSKKKKYSCTI